MVHYSHRADLTVSRLWSGRLTTSQCESRKRRMGAAAFSTPRSRALASPTLEPGSSGVQYAKYKILLISILFKILISISIESHPWTWQSRQNFSLSQSDHLTRSHQLHLSPPPRDVRVQRLLQVGHVWGVVHKHHLEITPWFRHLYPFSHLDKQMGRGAG